MSAPCPICKTVLKNAPIDDFNRDVTSFSCYRCGDFALTREAHINMQGDLERNENADIKLSHAIRKMQGINKRVELSTSTIDAILAKPLPRPKEQADLLIRWLAENSDGLGDHFSFDPMMNYLSIIGAKFESGFVLVLEHLINSGFVKGGEIQKIEYMGDVESQYYLTGEFMLTLEGWEYYETLLKGGVVYRKAFMAMKFGDPELNKILEDVFKPSVKMAGFDLLKLDDIPRAGLIDDRLRVEIQSSDFLIADLTHDNLGAYWEAGYAEGLGKPVIYTCEQEKFNSQKTHFDTNHHLTVLWDKHSPNMAGELLKATIRATLPMLAKQED